MRFFIEFVEKERERERQGERERDKYFLFPGFVSFLLSTTTRGIDNTHGTVSCGKTKGGEFLGECPRKAKREENEEKTKKRGKKTHFLHSSTSYFLPTQSRCSAKQLREPPPTPPRLWRPPLRHAVQTARKTTSTGPATPQSVPRRRSSSEGASLSGQLCSPPQSPGRWSSASRATSGSLRLLQVRPRAHARAL